MIKFKDIFKKIIFFILDVIDWLDIYHEPTGINMFILRKGKKTNDLLKTKNRTWQRALCVTLNKIYLKELKLRKFIHDFREKIYELFSYIW